MWSDPIDELFAGVDALVADLEEQGYKVRDRFEATLARAKRHRELENKTGKVGFEATNG